MKTKIMNRLSKAYLGMGIMMATPMMSLAQGKSMPWDSTLTKITDSLNGSVVKGLAVISIIFCGFGVAFSEGGSALRRCMWLCLGLSLSLAAATVVNNLFDFSIKA